MKFYGVKKQRAWDNMMKQILLEQLVAYRTGELSREAFEKRLDEQLYVSAAI